MRYRYDLAGRLIEAANSDGARIALSYDALGQLRREERTGQGILSALHHAYDALGNRIATTLPDGRNLRWLHHSPARRSAHPQTSSPPGFGQTPPRANPPTHKQATKSSAAATPTTPPATSPASTITSTAPPATPTTRLAA